MRRVGSVTAAIALAGLLPALGTADVAAPRQISIDPLTDVVGQHETGVEPDSISFGNTVVATFQVGRMQTGGASGIGWATSTDGGTTWTSGVLPQLTVHGSPPGPYARASDPTVAYDRVHGVWLISALAVREGRIGVDLLARREPIVGRAHVERARNGFARHRQVRPRQELDRVRHRRGEPARRKLLRRLDGPPHRRGCGSGRRDVVGRRAHVGSAEHEAGGGRRRLPTGRPAGRLHRGRLLGRGGRGRVAVDERRADVLGSRPHRSSAVACDSRAACAALPVGRGRRLRPRVRRVAGLSVSLRMPGERHSPRELAGRRSLVTPRPRPDRRRARPLQPRSPRSRSRPDYSRRRHPARPRVLRGAATRVHG